MSKFETIVTGDGFVKGELTDGGVVTISDEEWAETNEEEMEGNWEEVTQLIVREFMDAESPAQDVQSDETVSLDRDRVVDILAASSVVEAKNSKEEQRRAELLVEYLVSEGVYEQKEQSVVILNEFDKSSDLYTRLNWTSFLSYVRTELKSTVDTVERQKETVLDMFDRAGEFGMDQVETDLPTQEELLEDLKRMTGSEWKPQGEDELGYAIPPEGVDDEWEYKMTFNDIETIKDWNPTGIDDGKRGEIEGRLVAEIREMNRIADQTQSLETDLRKASIREIANLPQVQEQIEAIKQLSSEIFGVDKSETDLEESVQMIENLAGEHDMDITEGGGVDTEPVISGTEEEAELGEADSVEDVFSDDSKREN